MTALIFIIVSVLGTIVLARLDPPEKKISSAVWVAFVWLAIACSRPLSAWMSFSAPEPGYDAYIDGSPLDRNVLTGLLIYAIVVLSRRREQIAAILKANRALVVFLLYCGISMMWADYPFVSLNRWIRAVADVAMVSVILSEFHPEEAFKWTFTRVAALLLPLSFVFIRYIPSLGRAYGYTGGAMWTGVACDKNALGALCMLVGVVLITRAMSMCSKPRQPNRARRLSVVAILLAVVVYLLAIIDSKTALACFVMSCALMLIRWYAPAGLRRPWFFTAILIALIGATYAVLIGGVNNSALTAIGRDATLTNRRSVWDIALSYTVNPWLGSGFENFWIGDRLKAIVRAIGAGLNQAHNGYLEIYLNIGWIGLAALLGVIIVGYRNVIKSLRAPPEMSGLKLAFFLICLVYNITEAAFKIMHPVWIAFLWATMDVPNPKQTVAEQPHTARRENDIRIAYIQSNSPIGDIGSSVTEANVDIKAANQYQWWHPACCLKRNFWFSEHS